MRGEDRGKHNALLMIFAKLVHSIQKNQTKITITVTNSTMLYPLIT